MAFIEHAVSVRVAKQTDRTERLVSRFWLVRIVAHFANIELAILIKLGSNRAGNEGFVCQLTPCETRQRFRTISALLLASWLESVSSIS